MNAGIEGIWHTGPPNLKVSDNDKTFQHNFTESIKLFIGHQESVKIVLYNGKSVNNRLNKYFSLKLFRSYKPNDIIRIENFLSLSVIGSNSIPSSLSLGGEVIQDRGNEQILACQLPTHLSFFFFQFHCLSPPFVIFLFVCRKCVFFQFLHSTHGAQSAYNAQLQSYSQKWEVCY